MVSIEEMYDHFTTVISHCMETCFTKKNKCTPTLKKSDCMEIYEARTSRNKWLKVRKGLTTSDNISDVNLVNCQNNNELMITINNKIKKGKKEVKLCQEKWCRTKH
jgi:hypothetical protein